VTDHLDIYDRAFGSFFSPEQILVRQETYGVDIGQTSWMTAREWMHFADQLQIDAASNVLEIGSGSGGPAVYLAEERGCQVTGVDVNVHGVTNGTELARRRSLGDRAKFVAVDGSAPLPFETGSFDALVSNDVICHIPRRLDALREWFRVLRPGGRLLFSDALVVTGPISSEEIALRSSIGFYLFVPKGENERVIADAGFALLTVEDLTASPAVIAKRRMDARERHRAHLAAEEGEASFAAIQRYLDTVSRLASEGRLSRFAYLAESPRG